MDFPPQQVPQEKTTFTVLVTGANSGLGFATCCRLIDEFLFTRPQSQSLHLLFSTRDAAKGTDTSSRLRAHLSSTLRKANAGLAGISQLLEARIKIENVLVDLLSLRTIKALAEDLLRRNQRLDAVVLNAGIAGWSGVDWPRAVWNVFTDLVHATTYPRYVKGDVRLVAKAQRIPGDAKGLPEPILGEVFTANVFGHYLLVHWLAPLFHPHSRIVWTSSISAVAESFSAEEDLQMLKSELAYEGSKRLTDYLVLTSELPATKASVEKFLPAASSSDRPKMYVAHPGVCGTSIMGLHWFIAMFMFAVFYMARWLSSPWHVVEPYKGAVAPVWVVLAPKDQIEDMEIRDGKGKWGSATDVFGEERVARTEVEGWGFCGKVGVVPPGSVAGKAGRYRGQKRTTHEQRVEFEATGQRIWREIEAMREDWEAKLGGVEVDIGKSADV